ncbi:MAG: nucleotidyltransferase family protein [Anaerolineae bacterium]
MDVSKVERCDEGEIAAQVFHLCLRAPWDPAVLEAAREVAAQGDVAWQALFEIAYASGLAPLFYAIVRGQGLLPSEVEDELRLVYFASAKRNVRLFHELESVLRHLAVAGVPVVLLKGAALAEPVYANQAVRPVGDFDLLVRRDGLSATLDALAALGYVFSHAETHPGDSVTYENEIALFKPGGSGCVLEIHWSLFDSPYYQHKMPMDWFWQSAQPFEIGQVATLMLGPEALMLHLCGHLALHHGGGDNLNLRWLYDVAAVIASYGERMDWDEVLERAQAYDLVLSLQRVLPEMSDEWDVPMPAGVLERLRGLRPSRDEERVFGQLTAARRPVIQRFWADLVNMPDWRARVRYAWNNMFPSPLYMQRRYSIRHRFLLPLYYPYRWWLGVYEALTARQARR